MGMSVCQKCGKAMDDGQFYTYKNGEKTELCKKCMTMHIDNFDESTFVWLLEKMDVPYVRQEWNILRDKAYAKNPKLNGMSVFGKYLGKMRLRQWKDKHWSDTEELQEIADGKALVLSEEMKKKDIELTEKFKNGEISENEYKTLSTVAKQHEVFGTPLPEEPFKDPSTLYNPFINVEYMQESDLPNPAAELTDEDKTYLAIKWGRTYRPNEWVELEKTYTEMMDSFDIQDADTINTLILICKVNLKMNQSINENDVDGFQKLSRVYNDLRKSAKLTAMQNKEDKENFVDSIGELVIMCEKEGFIPRFATDIPQDKVDYTLKDMNNYLHNLVTKDLGFGQQIEDALKKIQIQKEMLAESEGEDEDPVLEDKDYEAFYEEIERQKELDNAEEEDET